MTKPLLVLRHVAEWPVALMLPAKGRHRRPVPLPDEPTPASDGPVSHQVLDEVSLEELLPPWPETPVLGPGAVIAQCFDHCPICAQTTAGVLHKDGWTCGQCLTPVAAGGVS